MLLRVVSYRYTYTFILQVSMELKQQIKMCATSTFQNNFSSVPTTKKTCKKRFWWIHDFSPSPLHYFLQRTIEYGYSELR